MWQRPEKDQLGNPNTKLPPSGEALGDSKQDPKNNFRIPKETALPKDDPRPKTIANARSEEERSRDFNAGTKRLDRVNSSILGKKK